MSRGRKIIIVQNVAMSALITDAVIRYLYSDVHGVRLCVIVLCVFLTITRMLTDTAWLVLRRGNDDKERAKKSKRGTVPGIIWHKVRLPDTKQKDRDSAMYTAQVSR